jgi:transcriptional regulator with XRE-family HTH domain
MDQERLNSLLARGMSTRQIARAEGMSQTTVRYWIRKYRYTTNVVHKTVPHNCKSCGQTEPSLFYGRMKAQCRRCFNERTVQRMKDTGSKIRELMGGRCAICGFNKWAVSLELHHLDARTKDRDFPHYRFWSWERLLREAEKCVLLCRNCHGAVHAGLISVPATAQSGVTTAVTAGRPVNDERA